MPRGEEKWQARAEELESILPLERSPDKRTPVKAWKDPPDKVEPRSVVVYSDLRKEMGELLGGSGLLAACGSLCGPGGSGSKRDSCPGKNDRTEEPSCSSGPRKEEKDQTDPKGKGVVETRKGKERKKKEGKKELGENAGKTQSVKNAGRVSPNGTS